MIPKWEKRKIDFFKEASILYITSVDISMPKGPSVNEREFIWALDRKFKNKVHFLISKPLNDVPELNKETATFIKNRYKSTLVGSCLHSAELFWRGNKFLLENNIDLIIIRMAPVTFGLFFLLLRHKKSYVIKHLSGKSDDVFDACSQSQKIKQRIRSIVKLFLSKKIVDKALAADACTSAHINGVVRQYGDVHDKLLMVPNATNTERFKPENKDVIRKKLGLAEFKYIVGYIGGSPTERGGWELINCLPLLLKKYQDIGLLIVGSDVRLEELKEHAEKLKVAQHVVFTGEVPYDVVPGYVNALDIGVAFNLMEKIENVGNSNQKIRQYLSAGIPVITTAGGDEFLLEYGLGSILDDPADTILLSKYIDQWLSLSENGKKEFKAKAVQYAVKNLSIEYALDRRMKFWASKLFL